MPTMERQPELVRESDTIEGCVDRIVFSERSTISEIRMPGLKTLWGLEDRIRKPGLKVYGKTAIPPGRYRFVVDYSPRFATRLPHVLEVPGFVGIRWHALNTPEQTLGCLGVGMVAGVDRIDRSREAMDLVLAWFARHASRQIWVTYRNVNPPKHLLEDVE